LRIAPGISQEPDPTSHSPCRREEETAEFAEFARSPQLYDNIQTRIAPGIFGHDNIKKAVACLLFGGTRKVGTTRFVLCLRQCKAAAGLENQHRVPDNGTCLEGNAWSKLPRLVCY